MYTVTQSCKHTHTHVCHKVNSLLRLLLGPDEVIQHSLRNPPFVNYITQQSNTYFSVLRGRKYTGACRLKKVHSRESLAFPYMVHRCTAALMSNNDDLLVSMQVSLTSSFHYTGEGEAEQMHTSMCAAYVAVFHWSFTTWHSILYGIQKSMACGQ